MTIIVTGAAGFIGYHVSEALPARGARVIGIDNVNAYYDTRLKEGRLQRLARHDAFAFHRVDITDRDAIGRIFAGDGDVTGVIHLAAQAGVRYSVDNPYAYVESNLMGQVVLLEAAKTLPRLRHFVYASSSSVYGLNEEVPFAETDRTDRPISLYAATKKSCEAITHSYSHLFRLPMTGLRFFTAYGPWGRPDMAYFIFAKAILEDRPIEVFNKGDMRRDFTYIDDIVAGILAVLDRPPTDMSPAEPPYRIYNLGNSRTEPLGRFIDVLEDALGRKAQRVMLPMQAGDVRETFADITASRRDFGYDPKTPIDEGLRRFADWYRSFHGAP